MRREPLLLRIVVPLLVGLIAATTAGCAPGQRYQIKRLPSGKEIKVIGVTTMTFPSEPPALMLKYETALPVDDTQALRAEADEIMDVLKIDAEQAHVTRAVVSANSEPQGFVFKQLKSFNYLYEKQADGTWAPHGRPKS